MAVEETIYSMLQTSISNTEKTLSLVETLAEELKALNSLDSVLIDVPKLRSYISQRLIHLDLISRDSEIDRVIKELRFNER